VATRRCSSCSRPRSAKETAEKRRSLVIVSLIFLIYYTHWSPLHDDDGGCGFIFLLISWPFPFFYPGFGQREQATERYLSGLFFPFGISDDTLCVFVLFWFRREVCTISTVGRTIWIDVPDGTCILALRVTSKYQWYLDGLRVVLSYYV
jgi:hypothetical protein